jgi:hypothetical protein
VKLALILLIPVMLVSAWQYTRREQNENRLALVASEVALRDVDIDCPSFLARLMESRSKGGSVQFEEDGLPPDVAKLSGPICKSLERVWRRKPSFACLAGAHADPHVLDIGTCGRETLDALQGILVITHESWHLRGVRNEARAHCYAVQTTDRAALQLGVPPSEAPFVARTIAYLFAITPYGAYHSLECRPGGTLDLHPSTPAWPTA